MDDLTAIKSGYDLRSLAARVLPGRKEKHSHYDVYSCPLHHDSSPSLTVYDHSYFCFGKCSKGGSVIDFLMEYQNLSLTEAVRRIKDENPEIKPLETQPEAPKPTLSMGLVEENFAHISEGLPYFHSRGITDPTAHRIPLGVKREYVSSYQTGDGKWIQFRAARFAVPNIFNGKVRAINYRRNDQAFLDSFYQHPQHGLVLEDLKARTGEGATVQNILELVSGKKYKQEPGSQWKPFNVDLIAKREQGETVYLPQPYLVILPECKEFDVLAAMDCGFPTIGITLTHELEPVIPKLVNHIPLLFIMRDNDDAGLAKAIHLQNILEGRGRIITPPKGYKDVGDLVQASELYHFMNTYGLEAILR